MKVFRKVGGVIEILAFPDETVRKGEYLLIEDKEKELALIVQVIEINYIDAPGILEDLVREGLLGDSVFHEDDVVNIGRASKFLRDTKLLTGMIRGSIYKGVYSPIYIDLPSRAFSDIEKISTSDILRFIRGDSKLNYPIDIGLDFNDRTVSIDAEKLDGSLTLITGMKGSGKSHLSKLLVLNLVKHGAPVLILDLNGEYIGLEEIEGIKVLEAGKNLNFTLSYLGRETALNMLTNILGLPGVSANLFNEIWGVAERTGRNITIKFLINVVNNVVKNLMIRDALVSRLMILGSSRFITEDYNKTASIEKLFNEAKGYIVILKGLSSVERKLLVEIFLSKLTVLLEEEAIPPLFLFAEEAHMYIRDTYWEDIITRMRHFGLFVVFITNQPDSLSQHVFRQLDNLFIFRFQNDHDLDMIARISNIDSDTVKSITRDLKRGRALVVGPIVEWIPSVITISDLEINPMGMTKKVFSSIF